MTALLPCRQKSQEFCEGGKVFRNGSSARIRELGWAALAHNGQQAGLGTFWSLPKDSRESPQHAKALCPTLGGERARLCWGVGCPGRVLSATSGRKSNINIKLFFHAPAAMWS